MPSNTNSDAVTADLIAALAKAAARFEAISAFADPYEIASNPEDFGGTDDGEETVCMAYDNMQGIAYVGASEIRAALAKARPSTGEMP